MEKKIIENYEDYEITSVGQVFSYKRNKYLKQYEKKNYLYVYLYDKNGKRKQLAVHRLVAKAFIPNLDNLPQINHKDENPKNNNVNNLEWCNCYYNQHYGTKIARQKLYYQTHNPTWKGKHHTKEAKLKMSLAKKGKPSNNKKIVIIDNVKYESITDAMKKLKISTRKLYKLLKERR